MKSRRPLRLRVEELEQRLVPSIMPVTDSNWAGYAVQGANWHSGHRCPGLVGRACGDRNQAFVDLFFDLGRH